MTPGMTDERLAEIGARASNASYGPWRLFYSGTTIEVQYRGKRPIVHWIGFDACWPMPLTQRASNAAFIAHARTDVPALIAEVKRLREREKELTAQLFAAGEEIEALRHDLTRHIEIASVEASRP